jgi:outer membrane protein assembly factor BamB
MALAVLVVGCAQKERPAPVDGGAYWPAYLGSQSRAPFAGQTVSTATPQILWTTSVGPGIRGVPVVTDQVIVAASADRHIYTLSRIDGSRFWKRKLKGQPFSPLLRADEIYVATDERGFFYVIHMTEGEELRRIELPPIATTPTLARDTLFVTTDNAILAAVTPASDEPLWTAAFRRPPYASPVVFDDWVVYVAHDSLFVVNRASGQRRSAAGTGEPISGETATDGQYLFATTEHGSIVAWRVPELTVLWQTSGFDAFIAGPAVTDTLGYAVTGTGRLVRFDAATGDAHVFGSTGAPVRATPTVVRNGLLVGDLNGRLHFLGWNGETLWTVDFDGSLEIPIIVHDGRVIVPFYSRKGMGFASTTHGRIAELR